MTLTFQCLNDKCGVQFDTKRTDARCPRCKTRRVQWLPVACNIGKVARGADRDLRQQADIYKLGNIRSAKRGEAVKLRAPDPPGGILTPYARRDGWGAALWTDKQGHAIDFPTCVPAGMGSMVPAPIGKRLPGTRQVSRARTVLAGRHTG